MPRTEQPDGQPSWKLKTPKESLIGFVVWLLGLSVVAFSAWRISEQTEWAFVADAGRAGADILSRMVPPDWSFAAVILQPLWDTLNIATLGTILGLLLATPVAFAAARNTTPSALFVRPVAMFVIVASRSINSLIWAMLLIAIVGPGTLAGIIAIALRSVGFLAKLLSEAIEEIDSTPVEAITAVGASPGQVIGYGIVPQIMPAFVGLSVFRWDINIRESTVLGFVGAGGIGLQLNASMQSLSWSRVSLILLAILATVVISEAVSARARAAIS
jgi:phosphonate transport system permease protein